MSSCRINKTQSKPKTNNNSTLPICFKNTEELIEATIDILTSSGKNEEDFSNAMNREVLVYFPLFH
ncbi:hypothetical protein [Bacillus seohaeanensis]|jgi:hypothetical protein|uniref:Uncharacterized protein n=1 Tax=Bacillus seohaeanensis TaxID=284580 RepID=A0ABW5RW01_9BACI